MELNGDRFQRLAEALEEAYPDEAKLRRMVFFTFDLRLNKIAEGADHEERIFNLIDKLYSKDQIADLVRGAHRNNPDNDLLRRFCNSHQSELLANASQDNKSGLESSTVQALVEQLPGISMDTIVKAGRLVLTSGASDVPDRDFDDFLNPALVNAVRLFGFLRLILTKFPKSRNPDAPRLLLFAREVDLILADDDPANPARAGLVEWIQQAEAEFAPSQPDERIASIPSQKGTLEVSLMVTVRRSLEPQSNKPEQYRVNGYLHFDRIGESDPSSPPVRPVMALSLSKAQDQLGTVCSWQDIPKRVEQFLAVAQNELNHSLKQELNYRAYKLMLEIFLPKEKIGEKVDQWPVLCREESGPLGKEHGVIVRFCDRLDNDTLRNRLYRAWDEKIATLLDVPNGTEAFRQHIESPKNFEQYGSWRKLQAALRKKIILKLCCGLPAADGEKRNLFNAVLEGDVPVAVWTRSTELVDTGSGQNPPPALNISDALESLLITEWFYRPSPLAERLKDVRYDAWAEAQGDHGGRCLGDHVAFLLDNPDRMPDLSLLAS